MTGKTVKKAAARPAAKPEPTPEDKPLVKVFRTEGGALVRMAVPLPEVMADQLAKGALTEVEE